MVEEQRVAIKFCFKIGLSGIETLVLVQKVYGNEALNEPNVFRWYSRFRDGWEVVKDDERDGRPKSTQTDGTLLLLLIWLKMTFESHQE